MGKQYTVSDGKLVLVLEEAEEGGFVVTSPLDPGLVTQAETLQEAFEMAHDAAECLALGRKRLMDRFREVDIDGVPRPQSPGRGNAPASSTIRPRRRTGRTSKP